MFLSNRSYSTHSFDPQKWISQFKFNHINERTSFQLLLEKFRHLPNVHQCEVQRAMSPGAVRESLILHSLLTNKKPASQIFQYIVDRASLKILSNLVESYLFRLLGTGNLNAVVSLVHILLQSDSEHYKLSNQFWSLLSSKACSLGHHASASLVYHEVVNPFVNFTTEGPVSEENEHIPFLLLPTAIEGLALVFAQNGNHIAIEGLRLYFKRYYSNFGHRDVYQTLYIAKIESLSDAGLFSEALQAFVALAVKYRGHMVQKDPKEVSHSLKYASSLNFKKRHQNISENISFQNEIEPVFEKKPFRPVFKFNDYNIEGGSYWAIFDGVLSVDDLPKFRALLRERIGGLMLHSGAVLDTLLSFIAKYHYSICKFVIACLCDSGNCSRAVAVANKIPSLFPGVSKEAYLSSSDFTRIFNALQHQFETPNSQQIREYHDMLMESYNLCHSLYIKSSVPDSCFRSFLNCYFFSPLADMDEITPIVQSWRIDGGKSITIDKTAYQKSIGLGLGSLKLLEFILSPI